MKTLSNIGLALGSLLFVVAMYLQFAMAPHVAYLEEVSTANFEDRTASSLYMQADDMMLNVSYACLLGGGLAFLMCLVGFMKTKNKMALLGALLSLGATFVGIIHGTHMFS